MVNKKYFRYNSPLISDSTIKYCDISYYKKALSKNDIWKFDYHVCRVFNNPSYTNLLLKDINLGQDRVVLKKEIIEDDLDISNVDNYLINHILHSLILEIEKTESENLRDIYRKGFIWFLLSSKLYIEIYQSIIPECYINILNDFQNSIPESAVKIEFKFLIKFLENSRSKAETSRSYIYSTLKSLLS